MWTNFWNWRTFFELMNIFEIFGTFFEAENILKIHKYFFNSWIFWNSRAFKILEKFRNLQIFLNLWIFFKWWIFLKICDFFVVLWTFLQFGNNFCSSSILINFRTFFWMGERFEIRTFIKNQDILLNTQTSRTFFELEQFKIMIIF